MSSRSGVFIHTRAGGATTAMAISIEDLHRFTVRDFERIGELGVLPDIRMELVDGLIVEMSPRGDRHWYAVNVLTELFSDQRQGRYQVSPESLTLILGVRDTREPDIVLAPTTRSNALERPRSEDIALLVEVADSSLGYDLGEKKAAYARGGIPEYWVVDIQHEVFHVFRGPNRFAETYLSSEEHAAGAVVSPLEYPDVAVPTARVFGIEEQK